ncbi:ribose-5-phosphate isomerase 2 [Prunus dulcis]|uniref:Ribose-5-phosphate isomerase 2 n=1 Tax=Prunus dulcis TaxID=3755 RepID=A0A4Y1QRS4_PRUDU|nr:ribose-5-phosphate isomerase 2 [Prunus dulcis]
MELILSPQISDLVVTKEMTINVELTSIDQNNTTNENLDQGTCIEPQMAGDTVKEERNISFKIMVGKSEEIVCCAEARVPSFILVFTMRIDSGNPMMLWKLLARQIHPRYAHNVPLPGMVGREHLILPMIKKKFDLLSNAFPTKQNEHNTTGNGFEIRKWTIVNSFVLCHSRPMPDCRYPQFAG